ncbi:hypothetical protein EYR40_000241 [Pleurotus pulmonarius]|nr:hypothetical protein EYR40_000241 [Pleurotus pulmonarius]
MKYFQATGLLLAGVVGANARTFTVFNACPFTIWPAMFTDLNVAPNVPNFATGWEAGAFTSVSFSVPDNWKAGRIWGRRNCDFSSNPGPNSCLDGGCNGGLLCDAHTGTGVPPASVAEWTLQGDGNRDFYDVSLVDGYNLPMRITNNVGCPVADCAVDLGPNCPAPLKGPFDASGFPVGCRSACQANLDGNPEDSYQATQPTVVLDPTTPRRHAPQAVLHSTTISSPLSHQPAGLDLIGERIHFSTGQFAGQVVRAELTEIQKADLGRKYARVDRRPLDPPPVVLLKLYITYPIEGGEREEEVPDYESIITALCDLAVKVEGTFILRYRVFDLFSRPTDSDQLAIQAECYGRQFKVYSTKEFPGLQASTNLTKHLARWGVRLNIRETERKRGKKDNTSVSPVLPNAKKRCIGSLSDEGHSENE